MDYSWGETWFHEISQPPPLLRLPTELLDEILSHLCRHCSDKRLYFGLSVSEKEALASERAVLMNLCLVSKAMRGIVSPVLFHYYASVSAVNRDNFLRTILHRPDLAAAVKYASLASYRGYYDYRPLPFFASAVEVEEKRSIPRWVVLANWHTPNAIKSLEHVSHQAGFHPLYNELLLTHLPQVERLRIMLEPLSDAENEALTTTARFPSLRPPLELPLLRRLTVWKYGESVGSDDWFIRVSPILIAATNLHFLDISNGLSIQPMTETHRSQHGERVAAYTRNLGRLKTLVISTASIMSFENFEEILLLCPKLEALQCFYHDELVCPPSLFFQALQALSTTLKRLRVRFIPVRLRADNEETVDEEYSPLEAGAMDMFTALEVLSIDQASFRQVKFRPEYGSVDPSTPEDPAKDDGQKLARILPPSIRVLFITNVFLPSIVDDLIGLAEKVGMGSFPCLRKIFVGFGSIRREMKMPEMTEKFKNLGITIKIGEIDEHYYEISDEHVFAT